jgi:hypothetical protein
MVKNSLVVPFGDYPAFSTKSWVAGKVAGVQYEGHQVIHELSRVLKAGSPLYQLITETFKLPLQDGKPFDLGTLIGLCCCIKFTKPGPDGDQKIESIKAAKASETAS